MRKRRIDAGTRAIARECISGARGPAETCELLSRCLYWDKELVSEEDRRFVDHVADEASNLPVGKRRDDWHPDYIEPKLQELAQWEAKVNAEVKAICGRILQVMELRRMEKKSA